MPARSAVHQLRPAHEVASSGNLKIATCSWSCPPTRDAEARKEEAPRTPSCARDFRNSGRRGSGESLRHKTIDAGAPRSYHPRTHEASSEVGDRSKVFALLELLQPVVELSPHAIDLGIHRLQLRPDIRTHLVHRVRQPDAVATTQNGHVSRCPHRDRETSGYFDRLIDRDLCRQRWTDRSIHLSTERQRQTQRQSQRDRQGLSLYWHRQVKRRLQTSILPGCIDVYAHRW